MLPDMGLASAAEMSRNSLKIIVLIKSGYFYYLVRNVLLGKNVLIYY